TRYRRCGKATCHCVRGPGHGPAHYLVVTLKAGKTEQILLSEEMLPVARQFLNNYNRWWTALEKVAAVNRRLLRLRIGGLGSSASFTVNAAMRRPPGSTNVSNCGWWRRSPSRSFRPAQDGRWDGRTGESRMEPSMC